MRNHSTTERAQGVIDETPYASGHLACRIGLLTWGKGLTKIKKPVQDPDPEPKRVDRNPLVHPVEHAGEVEVAGQPERGEAETPDAQAAERLRVRPAGQAVGNGPPVGILRVQRDRKSTR